MDVVRKGRGVLRGFVIGGGLIVVGVFVILVQVGFASLIYRGLRMFYGAPTADHSMGGHAAPRSIAVVGSIMVGFGVLRIFGTLIWGA